MDIAELREFREKYPRHLHLTVTEFDMLMVVVDEASRLRTAIELIRTMPILEAASAEEPWLKVDIINLTKALEVADGKTDPVDWVNEPCPRFNGMAHSPHWWNAYQEYGEPLRIPHWCLGEGT